MTDLAKYKSKAEWESRNPVLPYGVPGFEDDTGKLKIGDGAKTWSQLTYVDVAPYTLPKSDVQIFGSSNASQDKRIRRHVVDRSGFPAWTRNVSNTTDTQVQQITSFVLTEDVSELSFTFGNFFRSASNDVTVEGQSNVALRLGLWDGTTTYPIFWPNGSRDVVLEPSAIVNTTPVMFLGRKGQRIWVVQRMTWATPPTHFPAASMLASSSIEVNERGTALTDRTSSYGQIYTRTAGNWAVFAPLAITALVKPGPVVAILGDSIASDGSNDYNFVDDTAYGWAQGGLSDSGIPWVNLGHGGLQQAHILSSRNGRSQLFSFFPHAGVTHLLVALSTNDLSAGRTSAVLLAELNTLKTELEPMGIKVIPCTAYPRTNAGNTAVNASPAGGAAQRSQFIDAIRQNNGVGDGFYDLASVTESSSSPGLWRDDLRAASGITLVSGGTGYVNGDALLLPGAGGITVTAHSGGIITAVGGVPSYGGWKTDPSSQISPYRVLSNSPAANGIPSGVGAVLSYTGIVSAFPTSDGTHPQPVMARFIRQDFAKRATELFIV